MDEIGALIRKKLKEKNTVVWFSKQLNCSRTNVYKIFERKSLDTTELMRISKILEYDFFADLSECYKSNCLGDFKDFHK
jgi:predicted transcriptional regulator